MASPELHRSTPLTRLSGAAQPKICRSLCLRIWASTAQPL